MYRVPMIGVYSTTANCILSVIWIVVSYSYVLYTPLSRGIFYKIAHMATPALHLDAVVAMRSESRAAPRAIATVIFSFCFFVMPTVQRCTGILILF